MLPYIVKSRGCRGPTPDREEAFSVRPQRGKFNVPSWK
jgi:hypothetical protein